MDFYVAIADNDGGSGEGKQWWREGRRRHRRRRYWWWWWRPLYGRYKTFVYLIVRSWCAHTTEINRSKQLLHTHSTFVSISLSLSLHSLELIAFFICSFVWLLSATIRIKIVSSIHYFLFQMLCAVLSSVQCTCMEIVHVHICTSHIVCTNPLYRTTIQTNLLIGCQNTRALNRCECMRLNRSASKSLVQMWRVHTR